MSKDKKSKKGDSAEPLSKKERKALEQREAQLARELAERKAAKKSKKSKKQKWPDIEPVALDTDEQSGMVPLAGADVVEPDSAASAILAAESDNLPTAGSAVLDAEIKARVGGKAAARKALDELDRDDDEAVKEFNLQHGATIGHFATSTTELEAVSRWLHGEDRQPVVKPATVHISKEQMENDSALLDDSTIPEAIAKRAEAQQAEEVDPADLPSSEEYDAMESVAREERLAFQQAEEVETERGRVFEVGTPVEAAEATPERGFAIPSDAKPEVEVGRNGYKIMQIDGKKELQYTRITTFIKLIEDKTNLERWTKRKLMQGVILDQTPDENGEVVDRLGKVRDLIHNRDVAIAKARKADRKGKLGVGELADLIAAAEKALKDPLNEIIEELELLGGSKDAAQKGTDIHALTELYDAEGIEPIADMLAAGTITPADFADLEAYAAAMKGAQIKVLETEVMVVNDEKGRAGRLDKIVMVRFPGSSRSVKCVADVKTGSIDYGISVPMQLENYASMEAYDVEKPTERRKLGLSPTKAVVIHLPQGKGECHIYPVDLATGRIGNRITQEAREYRNTAKKGIDFTVDLATGVAFEAESTP